MRTPLYQVDAFTRRRFGGNPAAVCPLERWLDDATLQAIAAENNLSETAFFVRNGADYDLRWFTPGQEVDLCGHATLASAHVLFEMLGARGDQVTFHSKSGPLMVRRDGERLAMDFPAWSPEPCEAPDGLTRGLGRAPRQVLRARDLLAVFDTEEEVRAIVPDAAALAGIETLGTVVTAPGLEVDFVSRFFAPRAGILEDPVTGRAHCMLTPYWAKRLGRTRLTAQQVSSRGGELWCELRGDRVTIAGCAVRYLEGWIEV